MNLLTKKPSKADLIGVVVLAVVILVLFLLIFGASRLPELGRGLGKGIKNFKDATKEGSEEKS